LNKLSAQKQKAIWDDGFSQVVVPPKSNQNPNNQKPNKNYNNPQNALSFLGQGVFN
jgi:hypothetical protein